LNGTLWLPDAVGASAPETERNFTVPIAMHATLALQLGWTFPLAPAPAMAMVELRGSDGQVLASTMLGLPGPSNATLQADLPAGPCRLHFSTRGGSDGSSHGDFLDFRLDGVARQAFDAATAGRPEAM